MWQSVLKLWHATTYNYVYYAFSSSPTREENIWLSINYFVWSWAGNVQ